MSVRLRCNQLDLFVVWANMLRPYFLVLLMIGTLGIGQPTYANDAVEQLRSFTKNTKSASGDFLQQQVSLSSGSDVKPRVIRQQQGTFVFSRPGRFSWNTLKPFEQVMIADGKQLMMWDKDLNQVTYRKASLALAASPAAILFGNTALEEYFELNNAGERGNLFWVELIPKNSKDSLEDMPYTKIGIGMAGNLPIAMELRDQFGNIVLLSFSNLKTNIPILPSQFIFKAPSGAEVLKLQ